MTGKSSGASRRMLIVDDDRDLCDTLCVVAGEAGFEACGVYDGHGFRAAFAKFQPDYVVLDLAMPDEDGIELMRFLREQECTAKVAVASSQPDVLLRQVDPIARALGLDFIGVLRKPFTSKEFSEFFL